MTPAPSIATLAQLTPSGAGLSGAWPLVATMVLPLLGALAVALAPAALARRLATGVSLLCVVVGLYMLGSFDWDQGALQQFAGSVPWLPALGLELSLGVDSVSLMLVLLTLLLGPICVICSFTAITERVRTYYAWLLVLQAAMVGVFAARDLVLFYICFEFTLVPMFVLISLFGSTNRKKAAVKFFLYTFTGSIIALAGLVYVVWYNSSIDAETLSGSVRLLHPGLGGWSLDIATLARAAQEMSLVQQSWVMLAMMAGFAVKVPLFPLHTWLPLAHTEAPTAGSVVLAGVLLKLGTYALYRFVLPFVPAAVNEYALLVAILCVVGIIYGGLICWVQTDVKKLVAYSSVAHLGFCVMGLFALNQVGVTGSILYMINHGLSTGALFLCVGMAYERFHTRSMREMGGLAARMPVWATFLVFFTMASVGLPGLNGFVSEFMCLMGAFQASDSWGAGAWLSEGTQPGATPGHLGPWLAFIAGTGMIIAAIYLLYMLGRVVWGKEILPPGFVDHDAAGHGHGASHAHADAHGHAPADRASDETPHAKHQPGAQAEAGTHAGHAHLPRDLTAREIGLLAPLAALCLALGLFPTPVIRALEQPVANTVSLLRDAREGPIPLPRRDLRPGPIEETPAAPADGETPADGQPVGQAVGEPGSEPGAEPTAPPANDPPVNDPPANDPRSQPAPAEPAPTAPER